MSFDKTENDIVTCRTQMMALHQHSICLTDADNGPDIYSECSSFRRQRGIWPESR
jgi:hypothetical protein